MSRSTLAALALAIPLLAAAQPRPDLQRGLARLVPARRRRRRRRHPHPGERDRDAPGGRATTASATARSGSTACARW